DNNPCGIDCETLRESRLLTAKRVFTDDEQSTLEKLNGDDADRFFTAVWTLKEAFSKADGRGLAAMKDASFKINNADVISDRSDYRFMHEVINGFFLSAAVNIDSQFGEILNADDVF
ncbi:MAG: 4'-phosphopantetheinyl transferase family protein, partial [Huintestinicola sp.]